MEQRVPEPNERIVKDFAFEVKAVGEDALIEGYASVFGNVDKQGDIMEPGSFTRSISAWKAKGRPVPVLWQHDAFQPIGATTDIVEDTKGLNIRARLIKGVQKAEEAHLLAKAGVLGGLSIGFTVPPHAPDGKSAVTFDTNRNARVFRDVKLVEYSLVTFPANEEAVLTNVKSADPWVVELTEAIRELKEAVEARETVALLRELRTMMQAKGARSSDDGALASVRSSGDDADGNLRGVLAEAQRLLRVNAQEGRRQ